MSKKKKKVVESDDDIIAFTDICETGVYVRRDSDTEEYLVALPIAEGSDETASFIFVLAQQSGPPKVFGMDSFTVSSHRDATYTKSTHLEFSGMVVLKEQK